jgi:hypothetical protein
MIESSRRFSFCSIFIYPPIKEILLVLAFRFSPEGEVEISELGEVPKSKELSSGLVGARSGCDGGFAGATGFGVLGVKKPISIS